MSTPLNASLKQTFGFDGFRQGQEQTITQLLNGHSTLSIFPTGSGKSLCYQFTALQLPHLTIVVSPLLALIKDQLAFLASKGIKAASIDSTLKGDEATQVMNGVRSGDIKILMVSVERFKNERFRQFIESVPISMLVVDEAHCISEWGHNFRPDYLKLPSYSKALNIPLVLLLTATATKKVKQDMAAKFAINSEHVVQTGFYRSNLYLSVIPVVESHKNELLAKTIFQQQGSGIVYVTLQHSAEQVAQYLQNQGINAAAYHAGFDSDTRSQIQQSFMQGQVQVIVATIAFGMGIDKSDIRFVIHFDLPKSIENYSQEIGRAGRDGLPSKCFTLANLDGLTTVENFVYGDTPELSGIEKVIETIQGEMQHDNYSSSYTNQSLSSNSGSNSSKAKWELQLLPLSNSCNIKQLPLKTLLVQLELAGVIEPLYAYFADFKIKLLKSQEEILAGFNQDRQAFLQSIFKATEFKKIWGNLNFVTLLQDKSIERNRVIAALEYLAEQNLIVLETKGMTEVFNVNPTALSNPQLSQSLYHYFIDKEEKEIKRIASLVRFFELDTCLSRNLAKYFDDAAFRGETGILQCGHCSVCRGQVARLQLSQADPIWPSEHQLTQYLDGLNQQLAGKIDQSLTIESYSRFLAGMTVPLFGRNKVRQLAGFASCERQRYQDIREKVSNLVS